MSTLSFIQNLIDGNNQPSDGYIEFISTDHIRFHHGVNVSGHNYNCKRKVRIEKNIQGEEGYTITIYNLDSFHPMWGDNIQMAPKRMRIITSSPNKVVLRGYGYDAMGAPFSGYGITVYIDNKDITKCVLNMYDRDISIEYYR